jgi:hypothetical protein
MPPIVSFNPLLGPALHLRKSLGTHGAQERGDLWLLRAAVQSGIAKRVLWIVLDSVHIHAGINQQSHDTKVPPGARIAEGRFTAGIPQFQVRTVLDGQRHSLNIAIRGSSLKEGLQARPVLAGIRAQAGCVGGLEHVKARSRDDLDSRSSPVASTVRLGMAANQLGQCRSVAPLEGSLEASIQPVHGS